MPKFTQIASVITLLTIGAFHVSYGMADSSGGVKSRVSESLQSTTKNNKENNRRYLVLGLSYDVTGASGFKDKNCLSTDPNALYGCGTGNDGRPISAYGNFGSPLGLEVGMGFNSRENLRYEFTIQHRPDVAFSGNANFTQTNSPQPVSAELSTWSLMFSGYVDFAESGGSGSGKLTPYVGAGLGLSRITIGQTTMTFPSTATYVPGGHHTGLSWLFAIGVSRKIEGLGTLDLGWRYMDFGRVVTPRGPGAVVWHDRSNSIDLDLAPTQAKLRSVGLRISLRRNF